MSTPSVCFLTVWECSHIPLLWEYSHKSGIVLVGVLPNLLKCYTGIKIDRIYKFDVLLPQNIDRFSGSTPRVLIVTLPDKSPGVIPLDSRTRLDEIYNSKKAFNDLKEVLHQIY